MEQNNMFVPEWNNAVSEERNEIVFEKKNKIYGAYILRKDYTKNILTGFILTAITVTFITLIPLVQIWMKPTVKKRKAKATTVVVDVKEIPQEKEEKKIEEIVMPKTATQLATELAPGPNPEENTQTLFDDRTFGKQNQDGAEDPLSENGYQGVDDGGGPADPKKFAGFSRDAKPTFDVDQFVSDNVIIPNDVVPGEVHVTFTVDSQGKVTNVKLQKSLNAECDNEAIRLVKKFPKFKPAIQNGRAVSTLQLQKFNFSLLVE